MRVNASATTYAARRPNTSTHAAAARSGVAALAAGGCRLEGGYAEIFMEARNVADSGVGNYMVVTSNDFYL